MKKVISLMIIICLLLNNLSACGDKEDSNSRKANQFSNESNKTIEDKKITIACIVNDNDQYLKLLQLGMSDAVNEAGAELLSANAYGNIEKEIELINLFVNSNVDGICIHPLSMELTIPVLKEAQEKGVKIYSAGVSINEVYNIGCIESDQWDLGKKTGEVCRAFIESELNGSANIAVINYKSQYDVESTKRTEGFKSAVTKLSDVKIITVEEAWLADTAILVAADIIETYPEVDIIWAANEGGTVGAVNAVKNYRKEGQIFVFGTDVNEQIFDMILAEDNILQAVTGQRPYDIGYQSVNQLLKEINGEESNAKIFISDIPILRNKPKDVQKLINEYKEMISIPSM